MIDHISEWRTIQARQAAVERAEKRRKMFINALTLIGAAMMIALVGAIWISLIDRASLGGL